MKTAIQQLVDIMNEDQVSFTEWFQDNYQIFIEKERMQIMKANIDGYEEAQNYGETSAEDYYNQTYN